MRLFARVCYSIAAALGLLSFGIEWRTRQAQAARPSVMRLMPIRTMYASLIVGLCAGVLAIVGKAVEEVGYEVGQVRPLAPTIKTERATARFTANQMPRRAQTLRSDYDLSDQVAEHPSDRHSLVGAH